MSYKTKYLAATDAYFHVYNRGVNRTPIFYLNQDYLDFLARTEKALNPVGTIGPAPGAADSENAGGKVEVIAFCLMPNHFHFILHQISENGMSEFMSRLCNGYVKAVNLREGRYGHLFAGKYKMRLVDDNRYLVHLSRYIHLNPVRAGLSRKAEEWTYSS